MKHAAPVLVAIVLLAAAAAAQAPRVVPPRAAPADVQARIARENALKAALAGDPGTLKHYFALADFYQEHERTADADRVLRNALDVDPGSPALFDKRLALWLKPLDPGRISTIGLEWLSIDGVHPVPVLLAAGHYLRLASAARGDGTDRALGHIDSGLQVVDGALPGNPDVPALLLAKGALLFAQSTLVENPKEQKALLEESRSLYQQAKEPPPGGKERPLIGAAASAVAAMSAMPPFGPPGAVRAPNVVPRPAKLKDVRPELRDRRMGRPVGPLSLELVIDPAGRVVQIHILRSVEGYDDVVADAVQKWEFEPTVVNGQPKSVILTTSVSVW